MITRRLRSRPSRAAPVAAGAGAGSATGAAAGAGAGTGAELWLRERAGTSCPDADIEDHPVPAGWADRGPGTGVHRNAGPARPTQPPSIRHPHRLAHQRQRRLGLHRGPLRPAPQDRRQISALAGQLRAPRPDRRADARSPPRWRPRFSAAAPPEPMRSATAAGSSPPHSAVINTRFDTSGRCSGSKVMCRSVSVLKPLMTAAVWSAVACSGMVLPWLLLILCPSLPRTEGASEIRALRFGEHRGVAGVEAARDGAGHLQVRQLVLADRDQVGSGRTGCRRPGAPGR